MSFRHSGGITQSGTLRSPNFSCSLDGRDAARLARQALRLSFASCLHRRRACPSSSSLAWATGPFFPIREMVFYGGADACGRHWYVAWSEPDANLRPCVPAKGFVSRTGDFGHRVRRAAVTPTCRPDSASPATIHSPPLTPSRASHLPYFRSCDQLVPPPCRRHRSTAPRRSVALLAERP